MSNLQPLLTSPLTADAEAAVLPRPSSNFIGLSWAGQTEGSKENAILRLLDPKRVILQSQLMLWHVALQPGSINAYALTPAANVEVLVC